MDDVVLERFMRDVRIENGCWLWTRFRFSRDVSDVAEPGGKTIRPARWAWRRWCGELEKGKHVIPICGMRHCVNPFHLIQCNRGVEMWKALGACPNGHPYETIRIRLTTRPDGSVVTTCMDCVNKSKRASRAFAKGRKMNANARLS